MRKLLRAALGLFVALDLMGLSATAALANSPHFKKGGSPTCAISGTNPISVVCTGTLAGLGGDNLEIDVTLSGFAVYQCQNGGGNTAPGQNRVLVGPSTTPTLILSSAIKNGNLTFTTNTATLSAPATVSGSAAGCPNPNWTGVNPVVTLTNIDLDIYQPPPPPVSNRIFHCTASDPLSGTVALIC